MKTKIKAIFLLALLFSAVFTSFSTTALAVDYTFKLVANRSALESELEMIFPSFDSVMTTGVAGLYQSDDYKIASAKALLGNTIFVRGLSGGLGFKGFLGEAEKRDIDGNIAALGFTGALSYDLSKEFGKDIPVTLISSITLSPEPISFSDTEDCFEFMFECDWRLLEQAAVVASYRYLEVEMENRGHWQKTDSTGYVGVKLFF